MISNSKIVSLIALVATIAPCLLFYFGALDLNSMKWVTLAATIVWFIATPIWMSRDLPVADEQVQI